MVSTDLRRAREKRAAGTRDLVTAAKVHNLEADQRRRESKLKFRKETTELHKARRESAARFAEGQRVTDGKYVGRITAINRTTGETSVKFGVKTITVDPRNLAPA
jgi:hypothetical protein